VSDTALASPPAADVAAAPAARGIRARHVALVTLVVFLVGRVPLALVGLWAISAFPLTTGSGPWQEWSHSVAQPWLAMLSRWDGRWYFYVAHDGYKFDPNGESDVAFAPLLPMLMWAGGHLTGRTSAEGLLAAGALVANAALLLAVAGLYVLVRRTWDAGVAVRTLLCLLVFPTGFFLSAVYPESLFLAAAVGAFLGAQDRRWWLAGVCGALAALSRTYGVLIVVPLTYEYLAARGWRRGTPPHPGGRWGPRRPGLDLAWLGLAPAASAAWLGHLWLVTGNPLSMAIEEAHRGRALVPPWQVLSSFFAQPREWTLDSNHSLADLGFVAGFGVLVLLTWTLRRPGLALFATLLYLPMISSGWLSSVNRFGLELFPAFIVLGQLTRWRPVLALYLAVAGALALYLTARFALGYWVG
jgi:hypothetical protein